MKRLAKKALATLGYHVQGTRYTPKHLLEPGKLRTLQLADVIARRMLERGHELTFIQIGAFDGVTKDPLFDYIGKYGWRGVLVEPQPGPAEQLRELYGSNERVVIMQAAIDRGADKRTLYVIESDTIPVWARGMASFDRQHVEKHSYLIPDIKNMIREIEVECISFDDVLESLPDKHVDLLQIDAEGADVEILKEFPFELLKPAIVHWEIKNLTKLQREEGFDRLSKFGYRFAPSGDEDMMALLD
jgi:FkbM family methyltransferase